MGKEKELGMIAFEKGMIILIAHFVHSQISLNIIDFSLELIAALFRFRSGKGYFSY